MQYQSDEVQELFKSSALLLQIVVSLLEKEVKLYGEDLLLLNCDSHNAAVQVNLTEEMQEHIASKLNHMIQRNDAFSTMELIDPEDGICVISVTNVGDTVNFH